MISESDRLALEQLKERVAKLREDSALLWDHLSELESRMDRLDRLEEVTPATTGEALQEAAPRPQVPPPLPLQGSPAAVVASPTSTAESASPAPTPPQLAAVEADVTLAKRADVAEPALTTSEDRLEEPPVTTGQDGSFELKLGTYWLVRVGVVMLLTALVFFAKYAYTNAFLKLGPLGKVILMYLAGGGLIAAGGWLQKARESLRNYGQVLFAGGLAGVYFTTYAAHHIPSLQIIGSPVLDGILLLAWAGFIVVLADRRKSELLAVFALGLAFYASTITSIGLFTLYSNLVLTGASVVFLLRNRWSIMPAVGLVATYVGYGFWRFHAGGEWRLASPDEGLWAGASFLMTYWAIFTSALFLSRSVQLDTRARVAFLTTNNLAFFMLFVLTMAQVDSGGFWLFCLIYGGVLLAAALLAQQVFEAERWIGVSYVLQGLTLVTAGFIAKFSGPQLGIVLAVESVVLLVTSRALSSTAVGAFAAATALLSAFTTIIGLLMGSASDLVLGLGVGGLLAFEAWWTGTRADLETQPKLRPLAFFYSGLALGVWLVTVFDQLDHPARLPVLALAGLLLTVSVYLHRVPELTLLSQGYMFLAQLGWCVRATTMARAEEPGWIGLVILGMTLALTHWWQRQKTPHPTYGVARVLEGLYAFAVMVVLWFWMKPRFTEVEWLGLSGLMAVAITLYGLMARSFPLAAAGQLFALTSGLQFFQHFGWANPPGGVALVPILCLVTLATGARFFLQRRPLQNAESQQCVNAVAMVYSWTTVGMAICWIYQHIPAREQVWVLALAGGLAWGWAGYRRQPQVFAASVLFSSLSLIWLFLPPKGGSPLYIANLLLPVLLGIQQQIARRLPDRYTLVVPLHPPFMVVASTCLLYLITLWVREQGNHLHLTASWAVLAFVVFVLGFALFERVYRWTGLAILGLALGRVILVDVWKLDMLPRVLSFFALGMVLVALGFLYNRYQERLRKWL